MKLVYISGIDGCGKTTQAKMLVDYLNANGISAQYQWLRWTPSLGALISSFKKSVYRAARNSEDVDPQSDSGAKVLEDLEFDKWLGVKQRLLSSSVVKFLWVKYSSWDYYYCYKKASANWCTDVLVLDRYYFDFVVDQTLNYRESISDFEKRVKSGVLKNIKEPDLFILLAISPEIAWKRKRDGTSISYLQKLEKLYKSILSSAHVRVIDGSQSAESIHNEIKKITVVAMKD